MNPNKFLLQIIPNEKMSPERKMALMAELSLLCVDVNFLQVKDHTFYNITGDFGIDVLHQFATSHILTDEIYFITEIKGDVGANIDREVFTHFMSQTDIPEINSPIIKITPLSTFFSQLPFRIQPGFDITQLPWVNDIIKKNNDNIEDDIDDDDDDDDNFNVLRQCPSVDDVLDKIIEHGVGSLTDQEKEILKKFK